MIRTVHPLVFLVLIGFTQIAQSQAPVEDATEAIPTDKPEVPDKVDVQPIARDDEIANRLSDILQATEWFVSADVEVTDGVVFLRGEATKEDYRQWATDLAQNTQDVAAVVNRMTIVQRSIWDLSPALAEVRALATSFIQSLPLLIFGSIVLTLTWPTAVAVKRMSNWLLNRRVANPLLRGVLAKMMMLPVILVGIYLVLRVSGLTQLALTVLGGTGIAGLIIGIAFRDIAENFLASILLSTQNPFRSGDLIRVNDHLGLVQQVTTRGTLLMTLDGNHVQIPNATMYKSTITNLTANPNRRVEFVVGIGYDDSISKAQRIIKKVVDSHPRLLSEPKSRVVLDELGAATVNLKVFVWLDATKDAPDAVRSSVMRIVKQSLLREGISLPDESREVIFPKDVPVRMISEAEANADQASKSAVDSEPKACAESEETEEVVSAAEGNLESDAAELQRQADQSWSPEDGTNLLDEHADSKNATRAGVE